MTWIPLSDRLSQLPLIIAGPILRRTQADSVTVWVALKSSRTITLEIFDTNKTRLFQGSKQTTQIGLNLHIAAVTATGSNILLSGENYLYNLEFGSGKTLKSPGIFTASGSITEITYPQFDLPSFALPPNDLQDLRLIHGSCRKPHGESLDALATVDKIIKEALAKNSIKRPHQLFLTGDQIYVDDVADVFLFMLMDAGETLLGWSETFPDVENIEALQPGKRNDLITHIAGFTASFGKIGNISNLAKSHLMKWGEFLAMYLFAWSDVLWVQPEDFPTFEDVHPDAGLLAWGKGAFKEESQYIQEFWGTVKDVRRVLANIPTYMIFDDHEITDDWYLNIAWCDRILDKPLGQRILQNGLLAYAICQGWGNTPEQFEGGLGAALLTATEKWSASQGTDSQLTREITKLVGLPTLAQIKQTHPTRLPHNESALTWHYTVNGPGYEVIVLDTRTWRGFPGSKIDFPALLSPEAYDAQISKVARPDDVKVTLIVSPGPVIGVPFLENLQKTAQAISEKFGIPAWGFDTEAWGLETATFERLFARLALRALPQQRSKVIFLSGDVHYSFGARLQYCATHPFESPQPVNTELVVVQFTSSSIKNEVKGMGGSRSLHVKGFNPFGIDTSLPTSEVLGWDNQAGKLEVGVIDTMVDQYLQRIPLVIEEHPALIDLVKQRSFFSNLLVDKNPQWWYRVDFIDAKYEEILFPHHTHPAKPQPVTAPLPGENRIKKLEEYLAIAKNHRDYLDAKGHGRQIVGVNNIGEITFESVEGKQMAVQTLWWRLESWDNTLLEPFPLIRQEVSLEFEDPAHPMADVLREVEPK